MYEFSIFVQKIRNYLQIIIIFAQICYC